jgi:hypothetical protein
VTDQMKKVMARYRRKAGGGKDGQGNNEAAHDLSLNSNRTVIKDYKKTVQTLKTEVKYLKYILALALLLNLIIVYFF